MSHELYSSLLDGDLSAIYALSEELGEDGLGVMYQWLQVAVALGNEAAAEVADGLYEAVLAKGGDETVACLHLEVGEWFIFGTNGVVRDENRGLDQLACAQELGLTQSVDVEAPLAALEAALDGPSLERFVGLFNR